MKLIDITSIPDKKKDYFVLLKIKYDFIIKSEIESLKGKELINAIKILTKFIVNVYLYDKNFIFLEEKINKLDKINSLIYNELIKEYNENEFDKIKEYSEKDFEKMKEYIYEQFLTKLDDINNIEALLKSLKPNDKKKFLEELMKKCQFSKDEFYSNYENKKIKLLCFLTEKGFLMKPNNEETEENEEKDEKEERENYYNKLIDILDEIKADLEEGKINKYQLEEFLKNKNIIQKLELLKLVLNDYNPEAKNLEFKLLIEEINGKITRLKNIKDSLSKFHIYKR